MERNYHLDIIRIFACFLVIVAHARIPNSETLNWSFFIAGIGYLSRPAIGLFFMLSGFLLLPVNINTSLFLKKRLTKLIFPIIFWTIIYVIYNYLSEGGLEKSLSYTIISFPFHFQGNPVLWYMYTLIGLYLVAPIISPWLNSINQTILKFYLILWGVTLCFPYLSLVAEIDTSTSGIFYYYSGFIGYFVLGFYIKKYGNPLNNKYLIILFIIFSLSLPIVLRLSNFEFDQSSIFGFLSLVILLMCLVWWKLLHYVKIKLNHKKILKYIALLSNLSFGVYLCHMLILYKITWVSPLLNSVSPYPLQTILSILITFILSMILCYIISLAPFSNYIIGYSLNRKNRI